jgi:predicted dehydrogenase
MAQVIRWGILGCGRIARKFAADLQHTENAVLLAAGSRNYGSAQAFATEFPVKHIHDSYEALASNPEVDVIYIASPHGLHHEHVMLCLAHKKAILCEKAFAINSKQATEMIEMARKQDVFLMEALWTKFMPHYDKLLELIGNGELGSIRNMLVNFGFIPPDPVPQRLYDPFLGGGTMLDIGIYNVFIALSVLGRPDKVEASMTPAATGVDEQCAVLFKYNSGALAQLFSSFTTHLATEADISGDRGRIRLCTRFYEPGTTIEFYTGRADTRQVIPFAKEAGFGYQYEARHVGECLRKGWKESPVMRHQDSLLMMETLDRIRAAAGIHYQVDG